jgi:hypothetical protein
MKTRIASLVVDAEDAELLGQFWSRVLGWKIIERGDYGVSIGVPGGPFEIDFRFVPHAPNAGKNRLHLDLKPIDSEQATGLRRLRELGARPVDVGQGRRNWYVLADPEDNEFCFCRP